MWILTVAIAFGVGPIPQIASAKSEVQASEGTEPVQHRIVQIKDLIEDFDESEWTAITENGGKFGANIGGVERAKKGRVTGYFNQVGKFVDDENAARDVIQLNAFAAGKEGVEEIRGTYSLTLPEFKRIQLEIEYEEPYVDGKETFDEYYMEVSERNKLNPDEWVESGTLKRSETLKALKPHVLDTKKEKYALRTFVANLSEWSGREILLDLVTKNTSDRTEGYKGRWTKLRMVGSTFDYHFDEIEQKQKRGTNKVNFLRNAPQYDVNVSAWIALPIYDLDYYPDTGPAPVYINNRWVVYFNSGYNMNYWPKNVYNGDALTGTMGLDFINFPGDSLYSFLPAYDVRNSLLRGNPPLPSSNMSIEPHPVIKPSRTGILSWKDNWDNGYTGVNSAFVSSLSGQSRVHAFLHVEDWIGLTNAIDFYATISAGFNVSARAPALPFDTYARIGYARSPINEAYPLSFQRCGNDASSDLINNASPIIECFEGEGDREFYVNQNYSGLIGAAGPAVYVTEDKVYLFYSRYVNRYWMNSDINPNIPGIQRRYDDTTMANLQLSVNTYNWDCICVARADKSKIIAENYEIENPNNPWVKYYNNSWSEPGRKGLSTPITENNMNRVVCNVLYNTYLNAYLMLCFSDYDWRTYLYTCSDLNTQQWGTGMMIADLPEPQIINDMLHGEFGVRLIGSTGSDKEAGQSMRLYTRMHQDYNGFNTMMLERPITLQY